MNKVGILGKERTLVIGGAWVLATILNVSLQPKKWAVHVESQRVKLASMALLVRASGNLEAKDSNTVKAQFDGPMVTKSFREGQAVNKGDILATIGRERIRLDYQSKKDALDNAEAELVHTRRDLRLQKQLFKKEAVAYAAVEDAARALVKAEQGLRSAKESFKLSQTQWNSSNVMAPITGTVVKDWVGEDKYVAAGKEIATVADVSQYTVHARVDELDIRQVHEGQRAEVRIQIFQNAPLFAVVTEVGSQTIGNGLPEIPVVLRLLSTGKLDLRPKLTAEARIFAGQTEPILSVPLTAVVNNDGNPHVWVLTSLNRLRKRAVELGRANPERTEVLHGISAGERICVTAEPDFADGMRVVVGLPVGARSGPYRTAKFLPPARKDKGVTKTPGKPARPAM